MRIIKDFIPVGRGNRSEHRLNPVFITIHDTANINRGSDALIHAKYLKGAAASQPASWHFTVDEKNVVQHLPLDEVAWHAGDGENGPGNRTSLAIEICENRDGDRVAAEANAAELVAQLLKEFNLGLERVVQHNHWGGKDCPRVLRHRVGGWEKFLNSISDLMSQGEELLTPIFGMSSAPLHVARVWLRQRAPFWLDIVELYYSIAPKYNIRADVALCQACKETGYFRFGNLVKQEQNNFCGLGATGLGNPGVSFLTREAGVEAHVQHLYAYATDKPLPSDVEKVDPRFDLVRRGTARYVEYLGAAENPTGVGWAYPGTDYGHSIVRDYLASLMSTSGPNVAIPVTSAEDPRIATLQTANEQLREELEQLRTEHNNLKTLLQAIYNMAKSESGF